MFHRLCCRVYLFALSSASPSCFVYTRNRKPGCLHQCVGVDDSFWSLIFGYVPKKNGPLCIQLLIRKYAKYHSQKFFLFPLCVSCLPMRKYRSYSRIMYCGIQPPSYCLHFSKKRILFRAPGFMQDCRKTREINCDYWQQCHAGRSSSNRQTFAKMLLLVD